MKLTKLTYQEITIGPGKKLTKLTNSPRDGETRIVTRKETHKTHETHTLPDWKETHKTRLKKKLTKNRASLRSPIVRISNNIRYSFSLCEFVSFTEVQCREEIKKGENIQYINSRGETHKTQKLTRPLGEILPLSPRAIARHPDPSISGCMSPRGGRLSPPPATDRAVRIPGSSSAATGPACPACHLWRSV